MLPIPLPPEQEAEAQRLYQQLKEAFDREALQLARLMASKPDSGLLGATEFAVRERVLRLGAEVLHAEDAQWARTATIRDPQGAVFTASQFAPPSA